MLHFIRILLAISAFVTPPLSIANDPLHEQVIEIPHGSQRLAATLFLPDGNGPFPLVVINHGKAFGNADQQKRFRVPHAARFFIEQGYAVALPMREGFGDSTGTVNNTGCNTKKAGIQQARSIQSAVEHLSKQSYINPQRIIIAGYSHGGLASLAYGGMSPPAGVKMILNFSGGLRKSGGGCIWDDALVKAVEHYAKTTDIPSLWLYSENDSFFPDWLAYRMEEHYKLAGGNSALVVLPPFQKDGHAFFVNKDGIDLWKDIVKFFLDRV